MGREGQASAVTKRAQALTPTPTFDSNSNPNAYSNQAWIKKGLTLRSLALAWSSLRAAPRVRRGPRDATDRAFQKAVQSVAGVGV